ncbi:zinc finger protein 2 [Strongylocentrotus purpuratus]|uniref:C2H2-type domain-containing protein n=1 Tax=Strongylocentrotus purpuratus TaxID=7668 RepID=A0A7M7N2G0_STRPU|nr:zinc finger protein 2 [Strongylocentrotus purpuratus]
MGHGGRRSDTSRKKKHSITVKASDLPRLKVVKVEAKCKDNNETFRWMLMLAEKYLGVDDKIENSGPSIPALDESKITDIQIGDADDEIEGEGIGDIVSNAARAIREDLEKEGAGNTELSEAEQYEMVGDESSSQCLPDESSSAQEEEIEEKPQDTSISPRRSGRVRVRQSKEGGFKCSKCPFRYPTKEAAKIHEATHDSKVQVCEKCEKEFVNTEALKAHFRFVHDKKYDCSDCDKKFGTKYLLMQHLRSHTGEKPFACKTCDKAFTTSSSLKAHVESHNVNRSYLCHECGAAYRRRDCLKQHILRCHKTEHEFQCELCGKSYKYRESLKNHLEHHKNVDEGKCPYQCHLCGKGFTVSATLQRHMNTHKSVFQCHTCDREFSHRHHLKRHLIVHTGERPFICPHCDRTFGLRTTLLTHLRLHTGEKPYKCKLCPIAFRRNYSLKNHMKKAHAIEVPKRGPGSLPLKVSNQDNVPPEVLMQLQLQEEEEEASQMRGEKGLLPGQVPIELTVHQIAYDGHVEENVAYSTSADESVVASELIDSVDSQQAVMTLANMSHQLNVQQMEELQQQVQQQLQEAEGVQQHVQEVHIQQLEDGTQTVEYVTFPVNFTTIPTSESEMKDGQLIQ